MTTVYLRTMKKGQKGRVVAVTAAGELGRRICDVGINPGTIIEVLGRTPLKDPVSVRVHGTTLALRNKEADHITVEVDS